MNSYRELLLRHRYRLSSLPRRVGKHILRDTLEFVLARPQIMRLTKGLLAYFPVLQAHLKAKAFALAGMRETNSRSGETNESHKSYTDDGMKKYTDLSSFLADLEQIEENSSPDEAVEAICKAYLELTPTDNELAKLDPFSPEYRSAVMRLYEQISGIKNYKPSINELAADLDIARSVRSPSPYRYSSSSKVLGEFISSFGWIFQALDVKQGDKVLEYGPGEGQLSIMLARMGIDVTVIDIDERYLEAIHAQCVSLGINIALKQGEFGDGFEDKKFDRILFFEAFHHALDHQGVVKKLKSHLTERGYVVFSGEPIVAAGTVEASFVPFPWGPRLDGLAVRTSNKFGWCELGFQQGYFVEMLMRAGWLVKYLPCPVTGRGNCYIATPSKGEIDLGTPYTILRNGGDAGWHDPEGSHRWTKSHAYLPLPEEIEKNGGQVALTLANYLPIVRVVKIGMGTNEKICRVYPGREQVVTISLLPSRYLHLCTDTVIPSDIIPGSSDHRELGVAVVRVKLH